METHGNLDGGIAAKPQMALPLASATTISRELRLTSNITNIAHFQTYWHMRSSTPTFPSQRKSSLRSSAITWEKLKNKWNAMSLPDMGDDEEWDEEEEIYK